MKNKIKLIRSAKNLCALIIVLFFIPITFAFANDGVLGVTPDGVYPITQSDIMMKSEEIYIDCTTGKVTCRFDFKNLGDAQTVLIGFPARLDEDVSDGLTSEEDITVRKFTARDKNGEIPVSLIDTIPNPPLKEINGMEKYSKWYSFSVDFAKNEEKTLYHTYEISFAYTSDGFSYMGYVIETGSLWKGPIGHSKVIFDMGDTPMYAITSVYPNNYYRIEGNKLIFERSDFKPDYNLWVTKNEYRYASDEWSETHVENKDKEKEDANKKIELFKTSPEAIRENSQQYYQLYESLINEDPVSALYIKSALDLPNGNEKPEITECRISEHVGNTWRFEIYGTDPDGDLVSYNAEIDGIEKYSYINDRGNLYFNQEEMKYQGDGNLEVQDEVTENKPFSITFTMTDATGNSDTETILLQVTAPEPIPSPTPSIIPQSTPVSSNPGYSEEENIKATESTFMSEKTFPMEEETVPMLITGFIIVLSVCLIGIVIVFIKRKNKGCLLFIVQLIFIGLSFYQVIGLLNMRDVSNGIMLSENISLKIGLCAVYWALSMLCMLAGIILTVKDAKLSKG